MKCPSFERIIDYLDNRLSQAEASRVKTHLADGCAVCGETSNWYQGVRIIAASDDMVAPPAWVLKRAVRIFEMQHDRPRLAERIGRVIASPVLDSLAGPALERVRSTQTVERQLLYRAGGYSIDLQIAPSKNARADLNGQVLKEGDPTFESVAGLKLDIARDAKVVFSTATNDMGEFKISGMEPGVYELRVELSEGNIAIPDLPVSES